MSQPPRSPSRLFAYLVVAVSLLPLAGCSRGSTVSGTVEFPTGLKPADNEALEIAFAPVTKGQQKGGLAQFSSSDDTFECRELAPGKYKITVKLSIITPPKEDPKKRIAEITQFNKRFDQSNSTLLYDVTSDSSQSITLDLNKGKVTKQ
jgi:hypothetical protein